MNQRWTHPFGARESQWKSWHGSSSRKSCSPKTKNKTRVTTKKNPARDLITWRKRLRLMMKGQVTTKKALKLLHLHIEAPNTVSVDFFRISFTVVVVIRPAKYLIAVLLLPIDKQFFELCFAPTLLNKIKGNNKHSQVIRKMTRLLNIINVTQVGNNRFFPLNLSLLPVLSLLPLPVPCSLPPPLHPFLSPPASSLPHFTPSCPLFLTPSAPFSIPSPCSFPPHLSLFPPSQTFLPFFPSCSFPLTPSSPFPCFLFPFPDSLLTVN